MIGSFKGRITLMKGNQHRYPENWSEIALAIKQAAHWRCAKCGVQCIKPGEKTNHLSRGERMASTLQVHHANYLPEDNRPENLIPLCSGCHLSFHMRKQGNVPLGQLSLWDNLSEE